MAEEKPSAVVDYHGSCHCGAFKYILKCPKLDTAYRCNCSICVKKGYLWASPVSEDALVVEKGDGTLTEYQFGSKTMSHKFCPNCGSSLLGQRQNGSIFVNICTLENIDSANLTNKTFDGAAIKPAYERATTAPISHKDGDIEYNASCHCGKVTYKLTCQPITEVSECNCSICSRNAYKWLYPPESAVQIGGEENLHCYRFGTKMAGHCFCSTCGVSIVNKVKRELWDRQPVNARCIDGFALEGLGVKKLNGKDISLKA